MKQPQALTYTAVRNVVAEALTAESIDRSIMPHADIVPLASHGGIVREYLRPVEFSGEQPTEDFTEQVRKNVIEAREPADEHRGYHISRQIDRRMERASSLRTEVNRIFRQGVEAAEGMLRYTTSVHLEGALHLLEWLGPAQKRSLSVVVGERTVVWSWCASDRKSLENRMDVQHFNPELLKDFVVNLTDRRMWTGDGFPGIAR